MNYPTESETWTRPAQAETNFTYDPELSMTENALRELRAAVGEYTRRAAAAEAELRHIQFDLQQARVIIRRLANVLEMGGDSGKALAEADEWLLKE